MKNLSGKTLIFYTYQNQGSQKPSSEHYNVTSFKKSSPQEAKIRDVLFELPINYENSCYHFRFKSQFVEGDQKIVGWIDISNLLSKVPMVGHNIYVKILKLPNDQCNKLFTHQKLKSIGLIDPKGGIKANQPQILLPVNNKPNGKNIPKASTPVTNPTNKGKQIKTNHNLLEDQDQSPKKPSEPATNKKVMNNGKVPSSEMESKKVPPQQSTDEKLDTFRKGFDAEEKKKQDERIAAENLDAKIMEWGFCGKKTLNNVTTLLATLHTQWPAWKPISLTQMLKPEDVQVSLKKAKFMLHPDKNRNKDPSTQYLAKRLFQILNDAKNAQK